MNPVTVLHQTYVPTQLINLFLIPSSNNDGCHSSVGKRGGQQSINYPQWCLDRFGSTLHEMLHALGFHHEQSRYDRDDYVTIMWENIEAGALICVCLLNTEFYIGSSPPSHYCF